jgi:hypothetical protein
LYCIQIRKSLIISPPLIFFEKLAKNKVCFGEP